MRITLTCSCGATFNATAYESAETGERLRAEFNELHSLCRRSYAAAMIYHGHDENGVSKAVADEREACARIAEAPIVGVPHTELSRGKMEAANTIARAIRARGQEG